MIAIALVAITILNGHKEPAWLDRSLAGYMLAYDEKHRPIAVHDPKTGFFLIRDVECDGGDLGLTLTRDRNVVKSYGYSVPGMPADEGSQQLVEKPLPSLTTGHRVKIGDPEARLRQLLGRPTKVKTSGSRNQFREPHYVWKAGPGEDELTYDEYYRFKAGQLIEIRFFRDANGG